jgi:ribose 5-phosphate isomerase B
MKIYIGTDHAGFGFKEKIVECLKGEGHEIIDKGAYEYDEHDDYPDFVIPVAQEICKDPEARGIILGATGQAEAFTANKFPCVRAIVYYGESECVVDDEADIIVRSREHNNSNILSLGVRYLKEQDALSAITLWLKTPYSADERHIRRLGKVDAIKI